ncbi:NAD(P)-binding protein [Eremomyces bilateralis CBS 781.70]|uniref:NAD(P)-binding protein n=1 Tax=Eremomyces bilateralis CBS 781.70 TaxID=1392243 RepID=A0A6G1G0E5_9PEZI|nr:NAD(P)-binding protein [Eremomyces bilateralis CBS 781.70]KAF1811396.1 NAD(P)-binding protein [Eremomyces bilateralis CBS 781.70]
MANKGQYVLITGASAGGIGHSLALEFASKGLNVLATVRDPSKATGLDRPNITVLPLEVTKPESVAELKEKISSITNGRLDILVNNAGSNYTVPALDLDVEDVKQMFDANVFGVMRMVQAFAPLLIETKGTIVQIGSLAGKMPYVFGSAYNASKAALHSYSDTLRLELQPFGVRVLTIVTGGVKSNLARSERVLRRDSIYLPIEPEYLRRVIHSQINGVPNEKYAKAVVAQVVSRSWWTPNEIWQGGGSWLVWFAVNYLPRGTMERVFYRMFNLWKLEKRKRS